MNRSEPSPHPVPVRAGAGSVHPFERLTDLASRIMGAPVALVAEVTGSRVRIAHARGLEEAAGQRENREHQIAAPSLFHAVAESGRPVVVADAREPSSHAPPLPLPAVAAGSYVGIPVPSPPQDPVLCLCVIDFRPRAWGAREVEILQELARWAASELALPGRMPDPTASQGAAGEPSDRVARAEAMRAAAEAENRAKDEFLALVSHELRTPLGAILIWAQLLREETLDAEATARALGMIERSTRTLAQLVDDLLDVSRIIAGKLSLERHRVELGPVIAGALDSIQPAAEAKGIRLERDLDPPSVLVSGDAGRLQQVVSNLLANAVKFTPEGGRVQVQLRELAGRARIRVRDTGMGIRQDFLPHVFDGFRQGDRTSTRSQRGLGIGLTLVRNLVELHGGSVEAESPGEEKGSTFTVTLPLLAQEAEAAAREAPASPQPPAAVASLQGVRVLVVDDDRDTRDVLKVVLERWGAEVAAVGSTKEALERLKSQRPQVLLSDIAMPGEDGYALIRRVRALESRSGSRLPAVALTAYASKEDLQRALRAGYQEHVSKPVEPAELVALVAKLAFEPRPR